MTSNEVKRFLNEICNLITSKLVQIEKTRYEVTFKEDDSPVTSSDIYIENLVKEFILKNLPNTVFIGEESFDNNFYDTSEYIVILDPIDGTENFYSGLKEWGVSFGLWSRKRHLGSFLMLPDLGIKLVTGDNIEKCHSRLIGLSSAIDKSVIELMNIPGEYRITGCAVFNLYNVIRGSFNRFINPKGARVWDFLPGVMLALEHGCKVMIEKQEYYGEFLDPRIPYRFEVQHS